MWLTACGSAFAINWDNGEPASDDWIDAANWDNDTVPSGAVAITFDDSDTAVLYSGDTGNGVNFVMSGTAPDLTIEGTLDLSGYIWGRCRWWEMCNAGHCRDTRRSWKGYKAK